MQSVITLVFGLAFLLFLIAAFWVPQGSTRPNLVTLGLAALSLAFLLIRIASKSGVAFLVAFLLFFSACATNTGDVARDARGRTTNLVLEKAIGVLGEFAVNSLMGATKSEVAENGSKDLAHSAAQGVWSQAVNWATGAGVKWAINSWSNRTLPKTAGEAQAAFNNSSAPPAAKADAIAAVISTAAGAPPKL